MFINDNLQNLTYNFSIGAYNQMKDYLFSKFSLADGKILFYEPTLGRICYGDFSVTSNNHISLEKVDNCFKDNNLVTSEIMFGD